MKTLNIATGVVSYSLNDACTIELNPTDSMVARRLIALVDGLIEKREKIEGQLENASSREIFEACEKLDAELRRDIDEALKAPVCAAVFPNVSLLAMADGLPVFCNLIFALLDEVDAGWQSEVKKTDGRIAKYTAKYRK